MTTRSEFNEWREQPITKLLYEEVVYLTNSDVAKIMNRQASDPMDDQWLKGRINGLSDIAGFQPELTEEEDPNAP